MTGTGLIGLAVACWKPASWVISALSNYDFVRTNWDSVAAFFNTGAGTFVSVTVGALIIGYSIIREKEPVKTESLQSRPRNPDALRIIVGDGGNYESVTSYNPKSVTRTLSVGIKNIDETHYISNCSVRLELPGDAGMQTYALANAFTLNAGEERFIPVAYYHEYANREEKSVDWIQFHVPIRDGFYDIQQPHLPAGTHFITIKATATETKACALVCKVSVDERGRLRLETA